MLRFWREYGWFSVTVLFLLLLAGITFYLSQQGIQELHRDTAKLNTDLHSLLAKNAAEWESEQVLMAYVLRQQHQDFKNDIARHVSLGLFVACVLLVAVDIHTRRAAERNLQRHLQEVTVNVYGGISRRLLGPKTADELDSILRQNFAKQDSGFQITLLGPPDDKSNDRVVAIFETWYSIKNITSSRQAYPFEVSIRGYEPGSAEIEGQSLDLPKFEIVKIDGNTIPIGELQTEPGKIARVVSVPGDSAKTIDFYVRALLLYRTRHTEVFYSDYLTEGSSLAVFNQAKNLVGEPEASVLHPLYSEVLKPAQGRWEFKRTLLPGQGWYVEWKPANEAPNKQ